MAIIFETTNLRPETKLNSDHASWVYNGLDCMITAEVRTAIRADFEQEEPEVKETYATAMKKVAPVLFMSTGGLKVDLGAREVSLTAYKKELHKLESQFNQICQEVLGYQINWRSPLQLKNLFYTTFGLKEIKKRNSKGFFAATTNSDALEKLCAYRYPQVFARYILAMRSLGKKIGFLSTQIDPDGYIRTSFNIAGTDTGRFNSAMAALGTGTNLQNVENLLRRPFVAEPGRIFVNVDLEQADARNVGARIYQIFYDEDERAADYLDACESGDLHTKVCAMCWKELDWPAEWEPKAARAIADMPFFGTKSYRDAAKGLGHGTNYFGLPRTMAMHTKTDPRIIEAFQERYFRAFPLIGSTDKRLDGKNWHSWIYQQLKNRGALYNLFGRRRYFFNRYKDLNTLRAAIAYDPQSSTGEFLDRGWLNLWDNMREAKLHIPVHDSILFSLPYEGLDELLPRAMELLKVTITLKGGRPYTIPLEAKTGFNWGDSKFNKKTGLWENEFGLRVWTGKEERQPPKVKTRLRDYL